MLCFPPAIFFLVFDLLYVSLEEGGGGVGGQGVVRGTWKTAVSERGRRSGVSERGIEDRGYWERQEDRAC